MKTIGTAALLLAFAGAGCAPTMPPEDLVTARASYERASHGATAQVDPADLHAARESLDLAEAAFKKDGDTQPTRDLEYIADRRTQIAEVRSGDIQASQRQTQTLTDMHAAETAQAQTTSAQLSRANQQLALAGQAMQNQSGQIATEKERREEADRRAAQAAADLAKFASVKQEARGMVITLSGSVLFASAKSDLLPSAQVKLNEVADALSKQDPNSKIVVEGHTDSQGGASYNQDLSQHRAQSVRDYLVSRGVASDRVTAQGFGFTRSVADNNTAEGRANNRRVEIVIQPMSQPVSSK
jgi:outer membrane protein OmpA-like peptidoglycan-associated protein